MKKILCTGVALLLLAGCAPRPASRTMFAMNTLMTLSITGARAGEALDAVAARIDALNKKWSLHDSQSEVWRLNHLPDGQKTTLSQDTYDLLRQAAGFARQTDGAFDPTIAPVAQAWGINGQDPRVPGDGEIAALLPLVDYEGLLLQEGTAGFARAGMQVDLGAIGKGAASDAAVRILEEYGVETALLSLGGNIVAYGQKAGGRPYKVGVRDPDGGQQDIVGYLTLTDAMVITSSDSERYFERDGVRYHHIFDPQTGRPVRSGLRAVTVVARSGTMADAYSTALFVMGLEKGLALQKRQGGFEALFVTEEKTIVATEGLKDLFTFTASQEGYAYEN